MNSTDVKVYATLRTTLRKEKSIEKHVNIHRTRYVNEAVDESDTWKDYNYDPFVHPGLTTPRPRVMKEKTQQEIEKEKQAAKDDLKTLMDKNKKLQAELRAQKNWTEAIFQTGNEEPTDDAHKSLDLDDDDNHGQSENEEN